MVEGQAHPDGRKISPPKLETSIAAMPFSKTLSVLAPLLIATVLATLPQSASAHTNGPAEEEDFSSSRIMATGPLNVVVFRVSGR